jgi:hypothetical protein
VLDTIRIALGIGAGVPVVSGNVAGGRNSFEGNFGWRHRRLKPVFRHDRPSFLVTNAPKIVHRTDDFKG